MRCCVPGWRSVGSAAVVLAAIPEARLSIYDGIGHGVHLARRGSVVDDIVDFLTATAVGDDSAD
jgi:pimeloyl-ACP methyl ester carboxylesterase